ncbi:MAG: MCP four helix bundle domain-containing protein, partial [Candidatus Hydrothermarchaeales archaeon]
MGIFDRIKHMKIGEKLISSFLALALLVAVTGYIGYDNAKSVGASGDFVLEEKVPIADASMEITIVAVAGRDAMGEYLLHEDPKDLEEIRGEFEGLTTEFEMWRDAVTYGTESDVFKGSEAGAKWIKTGRGDERIIAVAPDSETARHLENADATFEKFKEAGVALMAAHDEALELKPKAGEMMEEMDAAGGVMLEKATAKSFSNADLNLIWEQLMTVNDYLITGSQGEIDAFQEVQVEVVALP